MTARKNRTVEKVAKGKVMQGSMRWKGRGRGSLLAGGSAATLLMMLAGGGVALAPSIALADFECGNPTANGNGADTFQCTDAAPFAAIVYPTTQGAFTLELQNDVTVTTGGIAVTAAGTGDAEIVRIPDSSPGAGDPQITSTTGPGISLVHTGGRNITVDLSDDDTGDTPMSITGTTGIFMSTAGNNRTVELVTTNGSITGTAGPGVRLEASGNTGIVFENGSTIMGTTDAVVIVTGNRPGELVNSGAILGTTVFSGPGDAEVVNAGVFGGALYFENEGVGQFTNGTGYEAPTSISWVNTDEAQFSNFGIWRPVGVIDFGAGEGFIGNRSTGQIFAGSNGASTTLRFDSGEDDAMSQTGLLVVGGGAEGAATLIIEGLDNYLSAGPILFGANDDLSGSDGIGNDRVAMQGAIFNGFDANSRLYMDANVGAGAQASCDAAVVADCLDIRDGLGSGLSRIVLSASAIGGQIADKIVLIDATGGFAAESAFVLDENSPGYFADAAGTGGVDTGAYAYALLREDDGSQYYLTGAPDLDTTQLGHLPEAALVTWDLTTGTWFDRQMDLRRDLDSGGGVWLRAVASATDHVRVQPVGSFMYDTGYKQDAYALVGGADLLSSLDGNTAWAAGVTAGYVSATVDHRTGVNEHEFDGWSFGGYATTLSEDFFLDAIVNYSTLDLTSTGFVNDSDAKSVGVQVEGGWRLTTNGGAATFEPLAALAWSNTEVGDVTLSDGAVVVTDAFTSLRAAVGARMSGGLDVAGLDTRFSLTGRVWQEFDGEAAQTVTLMGDSRSSAFEDDRDTLADLGASVSVLGLNERLSVSFSGRVKFKQDYQTTDLSIGARYNF